MEILNLALKYYINIIGTDVDDFYDNIMEACADDLSNQSGKLWLIHALVLCIEKQGMPFKAILDARKLVYSQFDNKSNNVQLYDINSVWCKETYSVISNQIDSLSDYFVWCINCPTNLCKYFDSKFNGFFLTDNYSDFISYDITSFVDNYVSVNLKEVILENKKIMLLVCIPQFKEKTNYYVTEHMYADNFSDISDNIYFEYLWQIIKLKNTYNLTNLCVSFFGDTCLYTEKKYQSFLSVFKRNFRFETGFCFSLKDFGASLINIKGLHFSMWFSDNCTGNDAILLWKKRLATKTKIETGELILYDIDRGSVTEWVKPKDILFYSDLPVMTNYGTFLNGTLLDRKANVSMKCAENSLGSFTVSDSMKDIDKVLLLSGMAVQPKGKTARLKVISITEENFWRCVSLFAFVRLVNKNWNNEKMDISVPNETVNGYNVWLYNSLPLFLFDSKSMFSSIQNVDWDGITFNLRNKMFFMDKQSVSLFCNDIKLNYQINSIDNDFIMKQIEIVKPYWYVETKQLYDFCFDMVQRTYTERQKQGYSFGLDAVDAGFIQVKEAFCNDTLYMNNFIKLFTVYKERLYKDISKFGFLREV